MDFNSSKICHNLIEEIFNQKYFGETFFNYHFDCEDNYFGLLGEFRHLSLFSVCLHLFRCFRSCEQIWDGPLHCKTCSRIRGFDFVKCNAYGNLMVSFDSTILAIRSDQRVYLDVFLSNANATVGGYSKNNEKCCFFQIFHYARDMFAAFSGVLIRMYLNITLNFFSYLHTNIHDEKRIREIIVKYGSFLISNFWHEVNINYFYEFFDLFDAVNLSFCYQNSAEKSKYGPYCGANYGANQIFLTIIRLYM